MWWVKYDSIVSSIVIGILSFRDPGLGMVTRWICLSLFVIIWCIREYVIMSSAPCAHFGGSLSRRFSVNPSDLAFMGFLFISFSIGSLKKGSSVKDYASCLFGVVILKLCFILLYAFIMCCLVPCASLSGCGMYFVGVLSVNDVILMVTPSGTELYEVVSEKWIGLPGGGAYSWCVKCMWHLGVLLWGVCCISLFFIMGDVFCVCFWWVVVGWICCLACIS